MPQSRPLRLRRRDLRGGAPAEIRRGALSRTVRMAGLVELGLLRVGSAALRQTASLGQTASDRRTAIRRPTLPTRVAPIPASPY